ncbi:MAG: YbaK/EbsC family protein [Bacillota bacterium]|nr:YbaK/EbsC family protein [Bacillota bacterium]
MSLNSVKEFFSAERFNVDIIELEDSSATVDLAAAALGVQPQLIAKTLAFKAGEKNILIVTSGNAKIDNRKYKDHFKTKAKMLTGEEVMQITGHPVGGVCPFGLNTDMEIYLDESLKQFHEVYPAAGSPNCAVKLAVSDLERLTGGIWLDVCQSSS